MVPFFFCPLTHSTPRHSNSTLTPPHRDHPPRTHFTPSRTKHPIAPTHSPPPRTHSTPPSPTPRAADRPVCHPPPPPLLPPHPQLATLQSTRFCPVFTLLHQAQQDQTKPVPTWTGGTPRRACSYSDKWTTPGCGNWLTSPSHFFWEGHSLTHAP